MNLSTDNFLIEEGIIENIQITEREGDNLIKFKLKDNTNTFSLFGTFDYKKGDWLRFEYVIKDGKYYNVKSILEHRLLNKEKCTTEELQLVRDRINYTDNKPLAMELAYRYGILKNYELEEIDALYNKILKKLNGEDK